MARHPSCCTADHPAIARRQLLQIGSLGLIGTSLADVLRLQAQAAEQPATRPAKAKSVVFIFQAGGPSQHETFDPKPEAPLEIRGEYGTTQTRSPGVHFCEYLPKLAARSNRFSIVRTMHHTADRQFRNEHSSCFYMLHTGTTELPAGETNASVSYAVPASPAIGWPSTIELPRVNQMEYPGRGPGILGPMYAPWGVDLAPKCHAKDAAGSCPNCFSHDDPNDPARAAGPGPNAWWDNSSCRNPDFRLPDFGVGLGVTNSQLSNRTDLLRQLDASRRSYETNIIPRPALAWDAYHDQATRLLLASRPGKQNPFDLTQESDATRDRYGREEWGQGFLVARRLIEAGVRMVQVNLRGWDTHQNAFRDLKRKLLPSIDHCLSGFLDDLAERGLLEETLVVMCGEMGRTPRISPIAVGGKNASGDVFTDGRHHWGDVFPCFLDGGGIEAGRVIGASDRHAGTPISEAYTPSDLAATIFHLMGVGPDREFHDAAGRPYQIYRGQPIRDVLT